MSNSSQVDYAHLQTQLSQIGLVLCQMQKIAANPSSIDPEPDFSTIESVASMTASEIEGLHAYCVAYCVTSVGR